MAGKLTDRGLNFWLSLGVLEDCGLEFRGVPAVLALRSQDLLRPAAAGPP